MRASSLPSTTGCFWSATGFTARLTIARSRRCWRRGNAETDARRITTAALAAGSQDNASAVLIDILDLPAPDHDIITAGMAHLPIEAPPSAGDNVDGFRLEQLLADGRYARVFRAVDSQKIGRAHV